MEFTGTHQEWNEIIARQTPAQFLQSWQWGQFQTAMGRRIYHIYHKNIAMLAIAYPLYRNAWYLMCPRGPIGVPDQAWWDDVASWAKQQGAVFVRCEPADTQAVPGSAVHTRDVSPAVNRILTLDESQQTLLGAMSQKTRYNINLAQKKDVVVQSYKHGQISGEIIQAWHRLTQETSQRNNISAHPKTYYETLLKTDPDVTVYVARLDQQILAMAIMISCADTVTYLFGASSRSHKELMAPYLLHWTAISESRAAGYTYYDLGGIAPDDVSNHPLAGVTRFKKGFGGSIVHYPGTFDIVLKPFQYKLYSIARSIRRSI